MKQKILIAIVFIVISFSGRGETSPSPPNEHNWNNTGSLQCYTANDTITFNNLSDGTIVTDQYQINGVIFSGYKGSTPPVVYDYSPKYSYGKILHSDDWFNPLRINFVDPINVSEYHPAKRIEFDNVVDSIISQNLEVDYISIDVYDSMNVLIYHYLSSSPEHVVLNFDNPRAAYITIDDSANTSFALDNILVDFGTSTIVNEILTDNLNIFPNPFNEHLNFLYESNDLLTITIYDFLFRLVHKKVFSNSLTIDTEHLPIGMYFYELRNYAGLICSGKVIKN